MTNRLQLTAAIAVDLVVLTVRNGRFLTVVIERGIPPFKGRKSLPGGFVLGDETLAEAATRELGEETGVAAETGHLEQLATYGDPERDPRGRVVSIAYLALVPDLPDPVAGSDAAGAGLISVDELLADPDRLAFDHHQILSDGVERARAKLEYSTLATAFCPDTFTVGELRGVYEAVWGMPLDPRNFHRKTTSTPGFVEETGQKTARQGGRPAQLYRPGGARYLHPPFLR